MNISFVIKQDGKTDKTSRWLNHWSLKRTVVIELHGVRNNNRFLTKTRPRIFEPAELNIFHLVHITVTLSI